MMKSRLNKIPIPPEISLHLTALILSDLISDAMQHVLIVEEVEEDMSTAVFASS